MTKHAAVNGAIPAIDRSDAIDASSSRTNDDGRAIKQWSSNAEDHAFDTQVDLDELSLFSESCNWEMEYDAEDAGLSTHTIADVVDVVDVTMNGDD